ncbi:hypothetical protein YC2023_042937 [Brassica napus]
MCDVSGAQWRSPVVLCPRQSKAGQADGESLEQMRVVWSGDLETGRLLGFRCGGRVVRDGVWSCPDVRWFIALARPCVLRRCSFGDERKVRYFTLIKRYWREGGQQEKSFLRTDLVTDPVALMLLLLAGFRLNVDGATASTRLSQFQNR